MVPKILFQLLFLQFFLHASSVFSQDNFVETKEISIGNNHACAVTGQGIKCWGEAEVPTLKAPVDVATNPRGLVTGNRFSCMLIDEGVRCWGEIPETTGPDILIEHKDLNQPKLLTVGHNHACAVTADDQIKCWGENLFGETLPPAGLLGITEISAGMNNTCAIAQGRVVCWGIDTTGSITVPEGLRNPRNLTSGWWHHCVATDDGIRCWGNPYKDYVIPEDVKMVSNFASGDFYNCAIVPEGVKCWDQKGKTKIAEETAGAYKVSVGTATACAITPAKGVVCWKLYGENAYKVQRSYVPAGGIKDITHVSAGYNSTCVFGDGNKLKCWGANPYGSITVPDVLPGPVSKISHGSKRTCAVRHAQLTCWGDAEKSFDVPETIGNVSYVAVGGSHVCAANPERAICWGENEGQVFPVPKSITNISKLAAGNFHACAETNNEVKCWGGKGLVSGVSPSEKIAYPRAICAGGTFSCAINIEGNVQCWGSKEVVPEPPPEPEDDNGPPPTPPTPPTPPVEPPRPPTPPVEPPTPPTPPTPPKPPIEEGEEEFFDSFTLVKKNRNKNLGFAPSSVRNATELGCGIGHACAISEGKIKCWDNDGSTLKTPEVKNPRKLSVGANHSCVLGDEGFKCWGGMLNMEMPDYSLTK